MRLGLSLAAFVLFTATRAFAQPTLAGDWDMTVNSPQGSNTVKVAFTQDGDKVTGLFTSAQGQLPFTGTFVDGELKFAYAINFQGMPLDIRMTGKFVGDELAGKADFGGFAEGDWTAKRAATTSSATTTTAPASESTTSAAASTTAAVRTGAAGTWDVMFKTPAGDFPATATLTVDAGKVSGTVGSQMGEAPISGTLDGKALKMSMTAQTPQGAMQVTLTGDLDGDTIVNGKAEIAGMGQMDWTAKRKQ